MKRATVCAEKKRNFVNVLRFAALAVALSGAGAVLAYGATRTMDVKRDELPGQVTMLDPFALTIVTCRIPPGRRAVVMTGTSLAKSDPLLVPPKNYPMRRPPVRIPFRPALRSPFRPLLIRR